jgi:hypothetical protein
MSFLDLIAKFIILSTLVLNKKQHLSIVTNQSVNKSQLFINGSLNKSELILNITMPKIGATDLIKLSKTIWHSDFICIEYNFVNWVAFEKTSKSFKLVNLDILTPIANHAGYEASFLSEKKTLYHLNGSSCSYKIFRSNMYRNCGPGSWVSYTTPSFFTCNTSQLILN